MKGEYLRTILVIALVLAIIPLITATYNMQGNIEILSLSSANFSGNLGTDFTGSFQVHNNHTNQSLVVSMLKSGLGSLNVDFSPASRNIGPGQTDTINFEILTEPDSGTGIFTGQFYAQYDSSNRDYFDVQVNLTPSSIGDMLVIDSVLIENEFLLPNGTVEGFYALDRVDIEIIIKSLFDESTHPIIKDIEVKVEIQNIGDRGTDDINLEAVEFDLDPRESKTLGEFRFSMPKDIENNKLYTIVITAEGEDAERVKHRTELRGEIKTKREADDIRLTRFEVVPGEVTCERELNIEIEVTNLGFGVEDEATYTIKSSDLDMYFRERFELESDPGRRDSEFNKVHDFTIADSVAPGRYPIIVRTYSDSTKQQDEESYFIDVKECTEKKEETNPVVKKKESKEQPTEDPKEQPKEDPKPEEKVDDNSAPKTIGDVESVDMKTPFQNKKIAVLMILGMAIMAVVLVYLAYLILFSK